jgi:sulfur carrier protein
MKPEQARSAGQPADRISNKGDEMDVTINGEQEQVADDLTISQLLEARGVERPEMVAVELNSTIVKRSDYGTVKIRPDDRIEFLYFMGGGTAG